MVRHFGCELEFSSDKFTVIEMLSEFLKADLQRLGPRDYKKWQIKDDHSTVGEVISPAYTMKKLDKIIEVCSFLKKNKIKTTQKDGFHVHIQIKKKEIPNIVALWLRCEKDMENYFPKCRRNNQYCKRLRGRNKVPPIMFLRKSLKKVEDHHYAVSAYRDDIGTIEFRMAEGTFDGEFVSSWIRFCFAFVEYAAKTDSADIFFSEPYEIKIPELFRMIKLKKKDRTLILRRRKP